LIFFPRHGLSYTTFDFSKLSLSTVTSHDANFSIEASITVKNTGSFEGSEVVQIYVSYPEVGILTPKLQLRGFVKARDIQPGKETKVTVKLDKYAISFWDTPKHRWSAMTGKYGVHVGKSSEDVVLEGTFELEKSFYWKGL
jgi:beta-glucosidase